MPTVPGDAPTLSRATGWTWDYVFDWTILKYQRSANGAGAVERPLPVPDAGLPRPGAVDVGEAGGSRQRRWAFGAVAPGDRCVPNEWRERDGGACVCVIHFINDAQSWRDATVLMRKLSMSAQR